MCLLTCFFFSLPSLLPASFSAVPPRPSPSPLLSLVCYHFSPLICPSFTFPPAGSSSLPSVCPQTVVFCFFPNAERWFMAEQLSSICCYLSGWPCCLRSAADARACVLCTLAVEDCSSGPEPRPRTSPLSSHTFGATCLQSPRLWCPGSDHRSWYELVCGEVWPLCSWDVKCRYHQLLLCRAEGHVMSSYTRVTCRP